MAAETPQGIIFNRSRDLITLANQLELAAANGKYSEVGATLADMLGHVASIVEGGLAEIDQFAIGKDPTHAYTEAFFKAAGDHLAVIDTVRATMKSARDKAKEKSPKK